MPPITTEDSELMNVWFMAQLDASPRLTTIYPRHKLQVGPHLAVQRRPHALLNMVELAKQKQRGPAG